MTYEVTTFVIPILQREEFAQDHTTLMQPGSQLGQFDSITYAIRLHCSHSQPPWHGWPTVSSAIPVIFFFVILVINEHLIQTSVYTRAFLSEGLSASSGIARSKNRCIENFN